MNRILLIDDDIGLSDLLSQLLELEGFVLTQAYDGEQGLMMAQQQDFDLILLDVMLPQLNGFDVLSAFLLLKPPP
ncbi:MAG TPA: DNA-binding response regulator, partial [Shewanella frigidimarina]|nr:DNA-binding response regulator [Shewanella frigidimarina]